jgi:hypothetical protein
VTKISSKPKSTLNVPQPETFISQNTTTEGKKICGVLNMHKKPCQRIGNCHFHQKVGSSIVQTKGEMEKCSKNGNLNVKNFSLWILG